MNVVLVIMCRQFTDMQSTCTPSKSQLQVVLICVKTTHSLILKAHRSFFSDIYYCFHGWKWVSLPLSLCVRYMLFISMLASVCEHLYMTPKHVQRFSIMFQILQRFQLYLWRLLHNNCTTFFFSKLFFLTFLYYMDIYKLWNRNQKAWVSFFL